VTSFAAVVESVTSAVARKPMSSLMPRVQDSQAHDGDIRDAVATPTLVHQAMIVPPHGASGVMGDVSRVHPLDGVAIDLKRVAQL